MANYSEFWEKNGEKIFAGIENDKELRKQRLIDRETLPVSEWCVKPCCANEKRNMDGGCTNCGDPCI